MNEIKQYVSFNPGLIMKTHYLTDSGYNLVARTAVLFRGAAWQHSWRKNRPSLFDLDIPSWDIFSYMPAHSQPHVV